MITACLLYVKIGLMSINMLLFPLRKMKKTVLYFLLIVTSASFCACRAKIAPYPSGIIFPLAVDQEIPYEGHR